MNFFEILTAQIIGFVGLTTACGVLIHDTHIDKAMSSALYKTFSSDLSSETSATRPSANLHPHAEQMSVFKHNATDGKALPRDRNKRFSGENKRLARGYHGENFCMPLAGEWS